MPVAELSISSSRDRLLPARPPPRLRLKRGIPRLASAVMNEPADAAAALKAMQDAIYREKILRARKLTPEQRLADVFELTNSVFARMHEGAMWQAGITDAEQGWKMVRQRLNRLQKVQDTGRFTNQKPEASHDR